MRDKTVRRAPEMAGIDSGRTSSKQGQLAALPRLTRGGSMAELLYPYQSSHCLEDTIHIWIYVDPAPTPPECLVAPILLPRGTWNLVWSLVTLRLSASSTPAIFTDPPKGITLEDGTLITDLQEKQI